MKSKDFFHKENNPQNFAGTQKSLDDQEVSEYITEILYEDEFEDRLSDDAEAAGNSAAGIMGRFLSMKRWKKIVLCVVTALVVMAAGLTGSFFYLRAQGEKNLKTTVKPDAEDESNPEEGLFITYKDKKYKYNEDVINFLCLGIDKDIPIEEKTIIPQVESGSEGFADTIVLISINVESGEIKMLAIPRETITQIKVIDPEGNFDRNENVQLNYQYVYGKDAAASCELMVDTVSNLLYQVPIQRYCSVNLNAVSILNDAIGGVDVQILEDVEGDSGTYYAGEVVHLMGDMALDYVRERDSQVYGSSLGRLDRQKQYITNYFATAKEVVRNDLSLPLNIYNGLQDNMCTNITVEDIAYLVPELLEVNLSAENMTTVPGEATWPGEVMEYIPNQEQLKEIVISYFYEEIAQK
ncbi:MAG: LCP family protein [Dorea sp.]|jgi:LCP family protein required for cell wall assembly|nr:LCP family protein [Dorea sp.]